MDPIHFFVSLRKVFPDEEKPVQRWPGNLQEVPDTDDKSFRVLQDRRGSGSAPFVTS